jgi:hypothetical protein
MNLGGCIVHQVGLPYHWGWKGLVKGDIANDLLALSQEPNVRIMESKALLCNVEAGRRMRGPAALEQLSETMNGAIGGHKSTRDNHGQAAAGTSDDVPSDSVGTRTKNGTKPREARKKKTSRRAQAPSR